MARKPRGQRVVDAYFSRDHFDDRETCCPLIALPSDVFGHHEDRTPTHGYAATREAAMAAFAKSWRRE
jgi:hypothetical protein